MHTKESESGTLETFTTSKIHNTNGKMPQEEPTCYVVVMKEAKYSNNTILRLAAGCCKEPNEQSFRALYLISVTL